MRAMYPGKQPGTLAAAQGGGSEAEVEAYGSTCPTAAPSSTTARGSMAASSGFLPREFREPAAATRGRSGLPWPRADSGRCRSIHPDGAGGVPSDRGLSRTTQRLWPARGHLEAHVEIDVGGPAVRRKRSAAGDVERDGLDAGARGGEVVEQLDVVDRLQDDRLAGQVRGVLGVPREGLLRLRGGRDGERQRVDSVEVGVGRR